MLMKGERNAKQLLNDDLRAPETLRPEAARWSTSVRTRSRPLAGRYGVPAALMLHSSNLNRELQECRGGKSRTAWLRRASEWC